MRRTHVAIAAALLAAVVASSSEAQQGETSIQPWAAFYGCWTPVDGPRTLSVTCMLPAEGSPFEVQQLTVLAGNIVREVSLRADGERRTIDSENCRGWESAAFSTDGSRVYTRGSATCAEDPEQLTSGMMSITPSGQFLQVGGVRVGEQRTVSSQTFTQVPWVEVPAAVQSRLAPLVTLSAGARTRLARPVDFASIEDALQFADAAVVEAWMIGTGVGDSKFGITRRELQRLVAMNAPTRVIDLSVALANPAYFAPRVERVANTRQTTRPQGWGGENARLNAFCDQLQFGINNWRGSFPLWSAFAPGLGLSYYGWFPECLGRGYYSRWAFGGYNYGNSWYGGPYYGGSTTVVVTPATRTNPGTVTKGQGYTRGENSTSTGRSGQGRSTVTAPTSVNTGGSSVSASSGSSSSGGTRSAGSNGTGRTAQPRNP